MASPPPPAATSNPYDRHAEKVGATLRSIGTVASTTRRYVLALAVVAVAALVAGVVTHMALDRYRLATAQIREAEQQRLLAQRAALFGVWLAEAPADRRLAIAGQMDLVADRLAATTAPGAPIWGVVQLARAIADADPAAVTPAMPEVDALAREATAAVARIDATYADLTEESDRAIAALRRVVVLVLLLAVGLLAAEGFLVVRPLVRRMERRLADDAHQAAELMASRNRLSADLSRATAELSEARRAADQANLAKSRFLAAAGHDLMEPVAALGLFIGTLERHLRDDTGRAVVTGLREARRTMHDRLESLLEVSRLEAGLIRPQRTTVALAPIMARLDRRHRPRAEAKTIELRVVESTASIQTDPDLFERILDQFLANAVLYTEPGGRVLLGCRRDGRRMRVEVHDSGVGIPEGKRRRIFEEFVQLPDPGRERGEGIGLGLAIVDRIARLLGLPLEVRSVVGKGSVFAVAAPLAPRPALLRNRAA